MNQQIQRQILYIIHRRSKKEKEKNERVRKPKGLVWYHQKDKYMHYENHRRVRVRRKTLP